MAISKRKSRSITVDEQTFRWKFDHDWKREDGTIAIQLDAKIGCKLIITLPDWKDDTFYPFQVKENKPKTVTPSFVENSIREAKKIGWNPEGKGSFHVRYNHEKETVHV